jgi:hypothetical protein
MKEEDIKVASDLYASLFSDNVDFQVRKEAFIIGAIWMKKQMMEGAVESIVSMTSGGLLFEDLRYEDVDYADKVKVVIIKEEKTMGKSYCKLDDKGMGFNFDGCIHPDIICSKCHLWIPNGKEIKEK